MKRYILNIFIFFAIVVVIDICVGLVGDYLQVHAKGGDTRKTNDLVSNDYHDIIVFGSSRASHHYDTPFLSDALGLDVYNAGYDGNGVVLSYGLLSMILERYQPKLIIFDVEPSFDIYKYTADNGNKRYITPLKPYFQKAIVKELIKGVSEEEYYKNYSGLMRYNTSIISKVFDSITGHPAVNKGFSPMNGVYTLKPEKRIVKIPEIDAFKLECFDRMLSLVKSKNVPIMVVASPKYGEENIKGIKPVINLCEKYHVPFVDYYCNNVFMQHKEWFNEPMHLNMEGAREFSRLLSHDINHFLTAL